MRWFKDFWKPFYYLSATLIGFLLVTCFYPGIAQSGLQSDPFDRAADVSAIRANAQASANAPSSTLLAALDPAVDRLAEGKKLYEAGRFREAAEQWQQAETQAQQRGDRLNQAMSLSFLSLAQQQLGNWPAAEQAIATSLTLLQPATDAQSASFLAQALNTQGSLQLAMGKTQEALETWQTATQLYQQADDAQGILGSQVNQAQAFQMLGLFRRAQTLLEETNQTLQTQPDSALKVASLRSLGELWLAIGNLDQAKTILEMGLASAQRLQIPAEISATALSLGNTRRAMQEPAAALQSYQQAIDSAVSPLARLEAAVNQFSLQVESKQFAPASAQLPQIQSEFSALTPSRAGVYVQVNLAMQLMQILETDPTIATQYFLDRSAIAPLLAKALQQAETLQDTRAQSYALGQLGHLYEQTRQWQTAQQLTQQALLISQSSNAADLGYRWQWQMGRIRKAVQDRPGAIAAYTESVNLLKSLRGDLIAVRSDVQFSFREKVEPVYRELVNLCSLD